MLSVVASLLLLIQAGVSAAEQPTLLWTGCGITKKAFMEELAKAYERKTGIKIVLKGGGATKGIREAAKGTAQIGGACRVTLERNPEERDAHQIPVAWDALAVIVHKGNPVSNITFKQLRNLYLGRIRNWKELGGKDAPIELYARKGKISGVGYTLRELVFANYDQDFKAQHFVKSSGPLEKAVVKKPNSIGVTGISSAKRRDVKVLSLEGKEPTYENIKSGDYVLYRPLYLVVKRFHTDPQVTAFIDFALSEEGKKVIRKVGTVPYGDSLGLVMKQLEQYKRATEAGL